MADLIALALSNFTLTCVVLGVIAAIIALAVGRRPVSRASVAEALLAYFILFSVAVSFFYNFVMHVFFGEMTARFIGWADSPFQAEVGYASLGFAAVGLLAYRGDAAVRLAAILGPAMFQWGAASEHVRSLMATSNLQPGNVGAVLYTDILLPVIGFALLWLRYAHHNSHDRAAATSSLRG